MIIERRSLLIGSFSLFFANKIPLVYTPSFDDDMAHVVKTSLDRYKTNVKDMTDWLYIFQEEIENKMKVWGTYKPLQHVMCEGKPFGNWMHNPNFFDECHTMGLGTDGFHLSFKDPKDETVRVRYKNRGKEFKFTKGEIA